MQKHKTRKTPRGHTLSTHEGAGYRDRSEVMSNKNKASKGGFRGGKRDLSRTLTGSSKPAKGGRGYKGS